MHLPVASSFFYEEMFPENREKKKPTKPRINYNFFHKKSEGSGFNHHDNGQ